MDKKDEQFLYDMQYAWEEWGELERSTAYDEKRLRELNPIFLSNYKDYKQAVYNMDNSAKDIFIIYQ